MSDDKGPLAGVVVVDLSRMLPGAVAARQLLDLGARLIKVEDPAGGDPMRQVPPQVDGVGVGFAVFLRGAESVAVDLRSAEGVEVVTGLAHTADVILESYRPGRLEEWGIGEEVLREHNPGLVWCSLPTWASAGAVADLVGHDLNICAASGALRAMRPAGVPAIQLADVSSGLLAASAVVAALYQRQRSGRGRRIDQPLAAGPLPFVTWAWAETAMGQGAIMQALLGGECPCYRRYPCADGAEITVAAIEPKFWCALMEVLDLPELAGSAFAVGPDGDEVVGRVASALAQRPAGHWLSLAREHGLPLSVVNDMAEARESGEYAAAGLLEELPLPGGGTIEAPGPFLPSLGITPSKPAPRLGEHTEAVKAELGAILDP